MTRSPSDFAARVRSVVRRIPHGRVATYGDVAAAAGRPRAHRAVGNIMRMTNDSSIPCHRVIAAGGKLGGYGRDLFAKRALLLDEGVVVAGGRVRDFPTKRWKSHNKNPTLKIRR
jgi:O-6-methylguanine DNA methyltransferase